MENYELGVAPPVREPDTPEAVHPPNDNEEPPVEPQAPDVIAPNVLAGIVEDVQVGEGRDDGNVQPEGDREPQVEVGHEANPNPDIVEGLQDDGEVPADAPEEPVGNVDFVEDDPHRWDYIVTVNGYHDLHIENVWDSDDSEDENWEDGFALG